MRGRHGLRPLDRLAALAVGTTANTAGERACISGTALAVAMGMKQSQARAYLYAVRDAGWLHQTERGRQNGRRGLASKYALTVPTADLVPAVGKRSQQPTAHAPTADPGSAPPLPEELVLRDAVPSLGLGDAPSAQRVLAVLEARDTYDSLEDLAVGLSWAAVRSVAADEVILGVLDRRGTFATMHALAEAIVTAARTTPWEGSA